MTTSRSDATAPRPEVLPAGADIEGLLSTVNDVAGAVPFEEPHWRLAGALTELYRDIQDGGPQRLLNHGAALVQVRDMAPSELERIRRAARVAGIRSSDIDRVVREAQASAKPDKAPEGEKKSVSLQDAVDAIERNYPDDHRYSAGRGWYHRERGLWRRDEEGLELRKRVKQWLGTSPGGKSLRARLIACELEPCFAASPDGWDADLRYAGLPDGRVLDIEGRRVIDSPPEGVHISRRLGSVPDKGRPARWLRFLEEMFAECAEVPAIIEWLRWWFQRSLAGDHRSHDFVFAFGPPGTGKSTLANAWLSVMGDYGITLAGEHFAGERSGGQHRQYLARLAGARFLLLNELPDKGRWHTADLNSLVSGERIEANFMRMNSFEFQPRLKLMVSGNYRPYVSGQSGFWRRIRMLDCRHRPEEPDVFLTEELGREKGRILAWALGADQEEPEQPRCFERLAVEYRTDTDPFEAWRNECLENAPDALTPSAELWLSYEAWCYRENADKMPERNFYRKLSESVGPAILVKRHGKPVRARAGVVVKNTGNR